MLLAVFNHIVDGGFDRLIGQIRTSAFCEHGAASYAVQAAVIQRVHTLGDARFPLLLVANNRSAGDAIVMTGCARAVVRRFTVDCSHGCTGSRSTRCGLGSTATDLALEADFANRGDARLDLCTLRVSKLHSSEG